MACEQSNSFTAITRLDGTNYSTWSTRCKLLLQKEGLWTTVSSPPDLSALDPASEEDAKKLQQAKREDERALCIIGLTLGDQQLVHFRDETTAAGCWTALRKLYVRDSVGVHIYLTRKLFRLQLQRGGDMMDHLNTMLGLFQELQEKELMFTELQKVYIILSSLDDSYDNFATSLEVLSKEELTVKNLTGRLLDESKRRHERDTLRESKHVDTEPLYDNISFVKKCFNCGARGHLAKHCKSQKVAKKGNTKPKKGCNLATGTGSQKGGKNSDQWVVDSGASHSIANDKKLFIELKKSTRRVKLANGWRVKVAGEGLVKCVFSKKPLHMLYIPSLRYNLLSVKELLNQGYTVTFKQGKCTLELNGAVVTAELEDDLFVVKNKPVMMVKGHTECKNIKPHNDCLHLWHRRLGHLNFNLVKDTAKFSTGIKLKACNSYLSCNVCAQHKSKVLPANRKNGFKTTKPLDVVFMDLIGPKKPSFGGACYVLSIIDHHSRYGFCYLLKNKTETFKNMVNWVKFVERKQQTSIKCIVTDNGTEFTNSQFVGFLKEAGIQHKRSAPYRPTHNPYIERRGQTLQAMVRTMLGDACLPEGLWGEAFMCANHILNNVVHSSTGKIPYTLWHGKKPDLSYIHTFGAPAWVHIPASLRRKEQPRARKMFFVGYEANHRSYRFWEKGTKSVLCSGSATFQEHHGWDKLEKADHDSRNGEVSVDLKTKLTDEIETSNPDIKIEEDAVSLEDAGIGEEAQDVPAASPVLPRRGSRERRQPDRYKATVVCNVDIEPSNFKELELYPVKERQAWHAAMQKEIDSLRNLGVFDVVRKPKNEKLVGCRWVYKLKKTVEGATTHKARLVARGFSQTTGDYDEVFAPSLKASTFRTMLAWTAKHEYVISHIDVETAYLHAPLRHEIYMEIPAGFSSKTDDHMCWKLKKSLYGLRQSGYEWNQCLVQTLHNIGFHETVADKCLFKRSQDGCVSFLLIFTDDIAIVTRDTQEASSIISKLREKFKIRELGLIRRYLGMDIEKTAKGYKISQSEKICSLLKRYGLDQCKPAKTPMATGFLAEDTNSPKFSKELYQSLIGSLSYLSIWSRPDIAYAVNQLAQSNVEPTERHWQAAKRVLRYLRKTMHHALYMEPCGTLCLRAYADASFADDIKTRKSTSGIAILLDNCLIGWRSLRQKHVSLSTMEAEFSSLSLTCTELTYYIQLMKDIGIPVTGPVTVYEDNQAAIQMATNIAVKTRSKHTDIRYLNVRQSVKDKIIVLQYCTTEDNLADVFTKALGSVKHVNFCDRVGLRV